MDTSRSVRAHQWEMECVVQTPRVAIRRYSRRAADRAATACTDMDGCRQREFDPRVAVQGFCLLLGQYTSPLCSLAAGGSPGRKLQSAVHRDAGLQVGW